MYTNLHLDRRPEAMADVPGVCELPLTRAVVQYRDRHEVDVPGGRIRDIGLAVVLEGRYASSAEVLDLGSTDLKLLDLSGELVVLDWIYEPTLEHATGLVREAAAGRGRQDLERFCSALALSVLERVGFGPLTRPTLLRMGFRDICRDLDLNDGTAVRISLGEGRLVRAHMDYDGNALLLRTPTAQRDPELEEVLGDAFPDADLRRLVPASPAAAGGYQVRFRLPLGLDELRVELTAVRAGLGRLLARYEPRRFQAVEGMVATFGHRETLARIRDRTERTEAVRLGPGGSTVAGTVH
jgi:hypothetical protein